MAQLLDSKLPHDIVMSIVKGNLKLSNLTLSDGQQEVASLAANGIISIGTALKRIKDLRS